MLPINDLYELRVDTIGEVDVVLKLWSDLGQGQFLCVVHNEDRMRVSHGNTGDIEGLILDLERCAHHSTPDHCAVSGLDRHQVLPGKADRAVWVGIRPEGFIPDENGPLTCDMDRIEVMGRDVSVVSTHPAMTGKCIRSIISADIRPDAGLKQVRFSLKPHKVFLFDKESEERV